MKVKDVLASKEIGGVETIGPQETVGQLVTTLREKRIGAMVVVEGADRLVGIISERDVIRALAEEGHVCLSSTVSKYMTADVMTTAPTEDLLVVLGRMTQGRFRHMPVVDGGRLAGVVSIGDVVAARLRELQRENEALAEFIRG
ncbi:MAG: CBS domain-containing protein [Pseudomonadota bacterium]